MNTVGYDFFLSLNNKDHKFIFFWKCSKLLELEVLCSYFVFIIWKCNLINQIEYLFNIGKKLSFVGLWLIYSNLM